jgi:peptidoglycan/LPS O-acetylase OafA/YrhL
MKYRREIDGLRAIAVLSVIFFHAGLKTFSGGYLGVDIFFVLSGYLITSIILKDIQNNQFSLIKFYEKRCRRILPAIFIVLLVSIPFAWFLLLPHELKLFARSLTYTSLSVSNIYFFNSTNYFDRASELKPLLHTWSLGVEEQFYMLYPLLLLFIWKKGIKTSYVVLAIISAISLTVAHWSSIHYPLASFYLLHTRAWELLSGALLGMYLFNRQNPIEATNKNSLLSTLGFILILISLFTYEESMPNPGFYTLPPIIGTLLIIAFTHPDQLIGKLLSNRILGGLGLISYSAYLWHQPLFAFMRINSLGSLNVWGMITGIVATIILAIITWKFIEQPARDLKRLTRKQVFIGSGLGLAFFLAIGITGEAKKGFESRYRIPPAVVNDFNLDNFSLKCYADRFCEVGDLTAKKSDILVIGDSHAQSILSAFEKVGHQTKTKTTFMGMVGCPPLLDVVILKGPPVLGVCEKLVEKQIEFIKKERPKKIFLVSRWSAYVDGDYDGRGMFYLGKHTNDTIDKEYTKKVYLEGIEKTIATYQAMGSEVYVMGQIPQQRFSAKEFYYLIYDEKKPVEDKKLLLKKYSVSLEDHLNLQKNNRQFFESLQQKGLGQLIIPDDIFCRDGYCPLGTLERTYYRDKDHISNYGAEQLAPLLLPYIQK